MKASKQYAAGILIYMLLSVGALSWGLLRFHGIDLVWEPFGSMMVLSRTILSLAALGAFQLSLRRRASLARRAVRVRIRDGYQ